MITRFLRSIEFPVGLSLSPWRTWSCQEGIKGVPYRGGLGSAWSGESWSWNRENMGTASVTGCDKCRAMLWANVKGHGRVRVARTLPYDNMPQLSAIFPHCSRTSLAQPSYSASFCSILSTFHSTVPGTYHCQLESCWLVWRVRRASKMLASP